MTKKSNVFRDFLKKFNPDQDKMKPVDVPCESPLSGDFDVDDTIGDNSLKIETKDPQSFTFFGRDTNEIIRITFVLFLKLNRKLKNGLMVKRKSLA